MNKYTEKSGRAKRDAWVTVGMILFLLAGAAIVVGLWPRRPSALFPTIPDLNDPLEAAVVECTWSGPGIVVSMSGTFEEQENADKFQEAAEDGGWACAGHSETGPNSSQP